MNIWIDAQLSPALANWMTTQFDVEAHAVRELGLREATDREIFFKARTADALLVTKDSDFVRMLELHGAPPRVLWLTIGNTSNARIREALVANWPRIVQLIGNGEVLIEIQG